MDLNDGFDTLPEPEPWGDPIIDVTPRAVLEHTIGAVDLLLARVRYNKLIDRLLKCVAHSLHTDLTYCSRTFGEITVGEVYHAVNKRGAEFVVAVQANTTSPSFGPDQAELDLEVCEELFPDLAPRFVHVELEHFSWGDVVVMYSLRNNKRGIQFDDEGHYRLVSSETVTSEGSQNMAMFA